MTWCIGISLTFFVNDKGFTKNGAESYLALIERGVYGTFHPVSERHLHRYCSEFDFRWDRRAMMDAARLDDAIGGAEGKRLFLCYPVGEA